VYLSPLPLLPVARYNCYVNPNSVFVRNCHLSVINRSMPLNPSTLALLHNLVQNIPSERFSPSSVLTVQAHSTSIDTNEFAHIIAAAWAPATIAIYDASIRRFVTYSISINSPLSTTSPVLKATICKFVSNLAGKRSGSYIHNEISALWAFPIVHNLPFPTSLRLQYLLKACDNLSPPSTHRLARHPVSVAMLTFLYNTLDLSNPFDVCCFAAACTAFWGQARLGELLPPNLSPKSTVHLPTTSNLLPSSTAAGSRVLHIPWSKTTGSRGASIYLCRQHGLTDPIAALDRHLSINNPIQGPLFSYRQDNQSLTLTKSKFLSRLTCLLEMNGFHHIVSVRPNRTLQT
jgi:hypothetical protein